MMGKRKMAMMGGDVSGDVQLRIGKMGVAGKRMAGSWL